MTTLSPESEAKSPAPLEILAFDVQHPSDEKPPESVAIPAEPARVLDSRCPVTRFDIVPSERNHDRCTLPAGHAWLHDFGAAVIKPGVTP